MQIAHLIFNALAVLIVLGCVALAAHLCTGAITCAAHVPRTMAIGVGVLPILSFLASALIAASAVRGQRSKKALVMGLSLGTVAAYASLLALAIALEFVQSGGFEDAIPALIYGTFGVLALVPSVAVINLIVLGYALVRQVSSQGQNAA